LLFSYRDFLKALILYRETILSVLQPANRQKPASRTQFRDGLSAVLKAQAASSQKAFERIVPGR